MKYVIECEMKFSGSEKVIFKHFGTSDTIEVTKDSCMKLAELAYKIIGKGEIRLENTTVINMRNIDYILFSPYAVG